MWDSIGYKLRYLFLPLVGLSVVLAAVYSLLDWLLIERSGLLRVDEQVVAYWLPGILAAIGVYLLMNRRLRVLKLSEKRNVPFFYQLAAVAIVAVPVIIAQSYVKAASGTLTHVKDAASIGSSPQTKYYSADATCLDRAKAAVRPIAQVEGQHNEYLNFDIFVIVPLCAGSTTARQVWVGLKYHDSVNNQAADSVKDAEYNAFAQKSQQQFDAEDTTHYQYLEQEGTNSDRRDFEKALQKANIAIVPPPIILIPHEEPFAQRTAGRLHWLLLSFGIGFAIWLVLILIPAIDTEKRMTPQTPAGTRALSTPSGVASLLLPSREMYGLPILLDINIAVYLAMVFAGLGVVSFQTDDLIAWGGNYGPADHGLGLFRLISSQFVHAGLMHIASNMYGLLFASIFLMPIVRNGLLIACYLIAGLGASIASLVMHPDIVSIGASGAIMGLWGVLLSLVVLREKVIVPATKLILINATIFVGLTLAQGVAVPGIDNSAHVGGLLTGFVLGIPIYLYFRNKPVQTIEIPPEG